MIIKIKISHNVHCEDCNDLIKLHVRPENEKIQCDACKYPRHIEVSTGGSGVYHLEDDLSGGSSSWDNAVKIYEEK